MRIVRRLSLVSVTVLLCLAVMAPQCADFERESWKTLRASDAALEELTRSWELWRDEAPRRFTGPELEGLRRRLSAANEWLAAGEAAFTAYWDTKKLVSQGQAGEADLAAARATLQKSLERLKTAVAEARQSAGEMKARLPVVPEAQVPAGLAVELAAADMALLALLLGELAGAVLGGKKGAIVEAGATLVGAVVTAVREATGEDIDLALPALRARIAERRKRLAEAVTD